ncbi:Sacsin [Chionoecetes opilio]|uniref:Sacsin n=1 Tax=Chionoecetes opilio TaxID=41210 RepID=A0A8J4Y2L7_CHIOP|nr:Sacsin [Chionoecetes opilio]
MELVQNAEDAGATKVALVHVPCDLQYPEADQVVQRFLQPCVPYRHGDHHSGRTVLFMDPSEPEDKMCRSLPLASLSQVLPPPACQRAFAHHLTTHHQATGHFTTSLFWFPLRQSPSDISDTVYSPGHVQRLLDSFKVEASVCLTFLKALEEITLGVAEQGKVTVTHTMRITSSDLETMRRERQAFRQHLQESQGAPDTALTCSYQATLQTEVAEGAKHENSTLFTGGK